MPCLLIIFPWLFSILSSAKACKGINVSKMSWNLKCISVLYDPMFALRLPLIWRGDCYGLVGFQSTHSRPFPTLDFSIFVRCNSGELNFAALGAAAFFRCTCPLFHSFEGECQDFYCPIALA